MGEDVLERFAVMQRERREHWGLLSTSLQRLWDLTIDLASAVRALRKDRERLDWLEMEMAIEFEDGKYRALFRQNMPITREAIDAALSARGGEDGA